MHDMPRCNPRIELRPSHAEVVVGTMDVPNGRQQNSRATHLACSPRFYGIVLELEMRLRRILQETLGLGVPLLAVAVSAGAQNAPQPAEGIDAGNYNIRQTTEFGYRATNVSGNLANYNTFVDLNSGVRLF